MPAPNVGDPGEAIATVPVEKFEMTELVDRYAPLPVERVVEIEQVPRAFDARKVGRTALRFAPWIGGVALVLTFVIGFVMFDGEGRGQIKTTGVATALPVAARIKPDAAVATNRASTAGTADPTLAANDVAAAATTTVSTEKAPTTDASAKTAEAPTIAAKDTATASVTAPRSTKTKPATKSVASAPKTTAPRGRIYITSNKPAQIFLDGKSASATTPRQLRVAPGHHKVTLWETTSGKTVTQAIDVPADKVVTVSKKF